MLPEGRKTHATNGSSTARERVGVPREMPGRRGAAAPGPFWPRSAAPASHSSLSSSSVSLAASSASGAASIPVAVRPETRRLRASLREAEAKARLFERLYHEERDRRLELELRLEMLSTGENGTAVVDGRCGAPPAAALGTDGGGGGGAVPAAARSPFSAYEADTDDESALHRANAAEKVDGTDPGGAVESVAARAEPSCAELRSTFQDASSFEASAGPPWASSPEVSAGLPSADFDDERDPQSRQKLAEANANDATHAKSSSSQNDSCVRDMQLACNELWFRKYKLLRRFKSQDGDLRNAGRSDEALKKWIQKQRTEFKKYQRGVPSSLTADMIDALTDIGFVFELDIEAKRAADAETRWNKRMETLRQFHKTNGHLNIRPREVPPAVQNAVRCIQSEYFRRVRKGEASKHLTKERMDDLCKMGYIFDKKDALVEQQQASWNFRLEELIRFKEANGHVMVRSRVCKKLYNFIDSERVKYREGVLPDERRKALEALGVDLNPSEKNAKTQNG